MNVTSSTAAPAAATTPDPTPVSKGAGALDVNDFLKLLTVQLSSQDPLKPMEDTQFISQMASFTSLEQMKNLSSSFATFSKQQGMTTAQLYLGKIVTLDGGSAGKITGPVSAVNLDGATPAITVNGTTYDASTVTSVSLPAAAVSTN